MQQVLHICCNKCLNLFVQTKSALTLAIHTKSTDLCNIQLELAVSKHVETLTWEEQQRKTTEHTTFLASLRPGKKAGGGTNGT